MRNFFIFLACSSAVAEFGWLSKSRAIDLASQRRIDAVVATSRNGKVYLRTRPDQTSLNNLEVMG